MWNIENSSAKEFFTATNLGSKTERMHQILGAPLTLLLLRYTSTTAHSDAGGSQTGTRSSSETLTLDAFLEAFQKLLELKSALWSVGFQTRSP